MDPDWRGISYWTWGIFHCFNAQLGPWKWTPGRVDSYWKPSFFGLGVSFFSLEIFVGNTMTSTLPATDSKSPWKLMVGRCNFLWGWPIFSCFCSQFQAVVPSFSTRNPGTEPTSAPEMDVTEVHWNEPSIHWRCWQWSEFGPLWYWDRCDSQSPLGWGNNGGKEPLYLFVFRNQRFGFNPKEFGIFF